jgi:hypothetical protein
MFHLTVSIFQSAFHRQQFTGSISQAAVYRQHWQKGQPQAAGFWAFNFMNA